MDDHLNVPWPNILSIVVDCSSHDVSFIFAIYPQIIVKRPDLAVLSKHSECLRPRIRVYSWT